MQGALLPACHTAQLLHSYCKSIRQTAEERARESAAAKKKGDADSNREEQDEHKDQSGCPSIWQTHELATDGIVLGSLGLVVGLGACALAASALLKVVAFARPDAHRLLNIQPVAGKDDVVSSSAL